MSLAKKKKEVITLISKMDETHLDALLLLLREPLSGSFSFNSGEWAETERRYTEVKEGKAKLKPARESASRIAAELKKRSR